MTVFLQILLVLFGMLDAFRYPISLVLFGESRGGHSLVALVFGILSRLPFMLSAAAMYRRLPLLGVTNLRFRPATAVTSFLIPIASWVLPFFVVRELWQATGPAPTGAAPYQRPQRSALVIVWFVFWVASAVIGIAGPLAIPFDIERTILSAVLIGRLERRRQEMERRNRVLRAGVG
jgi:hypothetical protein